VLATLAYDDTRALPQSKTHPLNLLFSDMVEQLVGQ
jgi:hypothetical protein